MTLADPVYDRGSPTRYRAGVDFGTNADAPGLDGFAKKHKKD